VFQLKKKKGTHAMGRPKRDVLADAVDASTPPAELPEHHAIARVIKAEGNHLYRVSIANKDELLVELATRLRSTFWIKRGGYVVVDTNALAERDNKLGGEIATVIMQEKEWRKQAYWFAQSHISVRVIRTEKHREKKINKLAGQRSFQIAMHTRKTTAAKTSPMLENSRPLVQTTKAEIAALTLNTFH
jgi:probable RNA-binding protein EIF1AD